MNKQVIKLVFNLVGEDKIKETIISLLDEAIKYKENYKFDTETGETDLILFGYEKEGKIYTATATVDENNKMIRIENVFLAEELITKLLKNIK